MRKIIINIIGKYYAFSVKLKTHKKIKKIGTNIQSEGKLNKPDKGILQKHLIKWSGFGMKINPLWYQVFSSLTNINDENYVPEDVFYSRIEPVLNNKIFAMAYRDKNSYDLILKSKEFPKVYLRNIDSLFFDTKYHQIEDVEEYFRSLLLHEQLIVKPSFFTGGGVNIKLLKAEGDHFIDHEGIATDFQSLLKEYDRNFLVQEHIQQHPFTAQFNESSLNTFRLLTYRSVKDNKIHLIQSVLRVGQKGAITDNQAGGGIAVGIDPNGVVSDYGIDKWGNKYDSFNNVFFKDVGAIPKFNLMRDLVVELSGKLIYSRLIGWDICIDHNGDVRIIELNNIHNEINFFQMTNGPLFSNFTDEVISHCKSASGTFSANYYLK